MGNLITKTRSFLSQVILGSILFFSISLFHCSAALANCEVFPFGLVSCTSKGECLDLIEPWYQQNAICGYDYTDQFPTQRLDFFAYQVAGNPIHCTNDPWPGPSCGYQNDSPGHSCGSLDPCCGSTDPCCGSKDPCCGSCDPCCEQSKGRSGGPGTDGGR